VTTGNNFIHRNYFLNNSYWTKSLLEKSNFKAVFTFTKAIESKILDYVGVMYDAESTEYESFKKILGDPTILTNNTISVSIPQFSLDVKRVLTLGEVRYSVKSNEYQDLRLGFVEEVGVPIKKFFEIYMRCFFDQNKLKRRFYPDDIAFTLEVENLDEFGVAKSSEEYTGCLPSFINDYNYDIQDGAESISSTEIILTFKKQLIKQIK